MGWLLCVCGLCSPIHHTSLFDLSLIRTGGWLLCLCAAVPPPTAIATIMINWSHINQSLALPSSPRLIAVLSLPRRSSPQRADCCVFCTSSSCIASLTHHLCQVGRGAPTCAQPSDQFKWFWWPNQPSRDNHRQWWVGRSVGWMVAWLGGSEWALSAMVR